MAINRELYQEQKLVFHIDKIDGNPVNQVVARVGDGYQKTVDVQIYRDNRPYNLVQTGKIGFKGVKPDGHTIVDYDHFNVTDARNGILTYHFPSNAFSKDGDYKDAYFELVGFDNTVDSTNRFEIKVLKNLVDETVVSEDYINPVNQLSDMIHKRADDFSNTLNNKINDANNRINGFVNDGNNKINVFVNDGNNRINGMINDNNNKVNWTIGDFQNKLNDIVNRGNNAVNSNQKRADDQYGDMKWKLDTWYNSAQTSLNDIESDAKIKVDNWSNDAHSRTNSWNNWANQVVNDNVNQLKSAKDNLVNDGNNRINDAINKFNSNNSSVVYNQLDQYSGRNLVYNADMSIIGPDNWPIGYMRPKNNQGNQPFIFPEDAWMNHNGNIGIQTLVQKTQDWYWALRTDYIKLPIRCDLHDGSNSNYSCSVKIRLFDNRWQDPNDLYSSDESQVLLTLNFYSNYNGDNRVIGGNQWSQTFKQAGSAWQTLKLENISAPNGAAVMDITVFTHQTATRVAVCEPVINVGPNVIPFKPDRRDNFRFETIKTI